MSRLGLALLLTPILVLLGLIAYERYEMYQLLTYSGGLAADIQKELKKGSSIAEVSDFLREKEISEWSTADLTNYEGIYPHLKGDVPEYEQIKVAYDANAIRRDYYDVYLLKFSVQIAFYFDKDKRLLWSHIRQSSFGIPPWGFLLPNWPRCAES